MINYLIKNWKISEKMKKNLGSMLNVDLQEEKQKTNIISLQIENVFSGFVFAYGVKFNKDDTIGNMKKQVIKFLKNKQKEHLCDFHFWKGYDRSVELTDEYDTKCISSDGMFKDGDTLAVYFNTGNILLKLLEKYPDKDWDWY